MPVIYSTHSPFLLDHRKIHRVLAVERQRLSALSKETVTVVRRGLELATASQLTLAPILSLIGVDIGQQEVIKSDRNVLLEEISAYYYMDALRRLVGHDDHSADRRLQTIAGCIGIEDIFEHLDFSTRIVGRNFDCKVANSQFVKDAKLSKPMLALQFWEKVRSGELSCEMFSEATIDRAKNVLTRLEQSFA